jgi:hypothetical protein
MAPANDSACRNLLRLFFAAGLALCAVNSQCAASTRGGCWLTGPGYRARVSRLGFEYYSRDASTPDLVFSLNSISQSGRDLIQGQRPELSYTDHGAKIRHGSFATENYTALEHGVEQSWVIHNRPPSSADIIISGKLLTPHRIRSFQSSWKFLDSSERPVCGYGEVTTIDRLGRTYRCKPAIESGAVTIRIPSAYLKDAEFPIVVDPVVGPEVPVCPSYEAAPARQTSVQIAASPYGYLAVWQDARGGNSDIFAARISTAGQVIDQAAIAVSTATGDQTSPAVAWNGHDYLVVWADRRTSDPHIYAARVQPSGEVLDKQGILLSATTGVQDCPRVASDGSGWYVVWQDTRSGSTDVYGCKVSPEGVAAKTNGISTRSDNEDTPDVAWNGSYYFVVWADYRNIAGSNIDIYGCRVTRTGIKTGSDTIISCTTAGTAGYAEAQKWPRICAFGTSWMVVWSDYRRNGASSDVFGTRVSSTGTVTDKGGISICESAGDQELPCIAYNGTQFLCTWRNNNNYDYMLRGARINVAGGVLDPQGFAISGSMVASTGSAAVGAAHSFLVGWSTFDPTTGDAVCSFVLDNAAVTSPAGNTISLGLTDQKDYSVAWNGSEYAVVWSQLVNGSYDILGARVSATGQLLTPVPVNLTAAIAGHQYQPGIAWNGSCYLLVWSGNETYPTSGLDIRGLRLNANLASLDSSPLLICTSTLDQTSPCVTASGTKFLVAWEDYRNAISPYYYSDIYGALVTSQGTISVISPPISTATGHQKKPAAASDGSAGYVVWEDFRSGSPRIYGARVSSSGQTLDTSGVAMPATYYYQYTPKVCWGQSNYLVAWSDSYSITGCRISQAGAVLDTSGIVIDNYVSSKGNPSVCWDGSKFQCVWEDYRSSYSGNSDIYHTTISSAGSVAVTSTVALVSDLVCQLMPKVIANGASGMLLYSRNLNYANCTCACTLNEIPVQEVASVSEAKRLSPGTPVALRGKIVTGAFSGFFYAQEPDRSCGIKVLSSVTVHKGDIVDVVGAVSLLDGERVVNAAMLSAMGVAGESPRPLGIRGDCVGGGALNSYTPGITGALGLNNLGLLIKTFGKVTATGSSSFTLESRPGVNVTILCGTLTKPTIGKIVSVTGISTCQVESGSSTRAIRTREQADIRTLN